METDYLSGTELGMIRLFISNVQNRLCKEGISLVLQMRKLTYGGVTGFAKVTSKQGSMQELELRFSVSKACAFST